MRRMGFVNAAGLFDAVKSIFGNIAIGDQVPNYPIKSQNTLIKLQGIVADKVPLPPRDIPHAQQLIQIAEAARQAEIQGGNGGDANKTIIIMYGEVIDALKKWIDLQSSGGGGMVPGGGSAYQPPATQAKKVPWLWIGIGAAALYFLTNKKR